MGLICPEIGRFGSKTQFGPPQMVFNELYDQDRDLKNLPDHLQQLLIFTPPTGRHHGSKTICDKPQMTFGDIKSSW